MLFKSSLLPPHLQTASATVGFWLLHSTSCLLWLAFKCVESLIPLRARQCELQELYSAISTMGIYSTSGCIWPLKSVSWRYLEDAIYVKLSWKEYEKFLSSLTSACGCIFLVFTFYILQCCIFHWHTAPLLLTIQFTSLRLNSAASTPLTSSFWLMNASD